jgi:hypothetical protein
VCNQDQIEVKITPETCTKIDKWFNPDTERCDPRVDCKLIESDSMHRWIIDLKTNKCIKKNIGMKFKLSLAMIMVIAIFVALLYLILDDRFFCLKNHGAEGVQFGELGRAPKFGANGNAVTSDKDNKADEESEQLVR